MARSQKNRDGLAWFARRASQWLLQRVKERKIVKGQANEETCKPSGNWKIRGPEEVSRITCAVRDWVVTTRLKEIQPATGKRLSDIRLLPILSKPTKKAYFPLQCGQEFMYGM